MKIPKLKCRCGAIAQAVPNDTVMAPSHQQRAYDACEPSETRESIRQFHIRNVLLIVLFRFLEATIALAVTPDSRLLSLVPPGARLVAGVSARSVSGQPAGYLIVTHNNTVDFRDFISLSGVDDSRIIQQVVFVAAPNDRDILAEHGLLASGHFDQGRIFKAAVENGASISEFKGIRVLVMQPFERDRDIFKDVRWLAVIESNVALFGTVATVQQELYRHLSHSPADPSLMQKLARLRSDDESWCFLAAFVHNYETRRALGSLDPTLADPANDGDGFLFGIHYGRHVELEYEITPASSVPSQDSSTTLAQSLTGMQSKGLSLLPPGVGASVYGVVKLSRAQYDAWVAEIAARGRDPIAPAPR